MLFHYLNKSQARKKQILPSIKTISVLLSEPNALCATQVKFPMSSAWISPMEKCELVLLFTVLYLVFAGISLPLCNHLNEIGWLPLLTVQNISVISPIAMLGGIKRGLSTGGSLADIPEIIIQFHFIIYLL